MNALKLLPASALALVLLLAATLFIQVAKAGGPTEALPSPADYLHACIPVDGTLADVPPATWQLGVLRAETCLAIQSREPRDTGRSFAQDAGRIYCFTEIKLPKGEPLQVRHVWKYEGKTMGAITLDLLHSTEFSLL